VLSVRESCEFEIYMGSVEWPREVNCVKGRDIGRGLRLNEDLLIRLFSVEVEELLHFSNHEGNGGEWWGFGRVVLFFFYFFYRSLKLNGFCI
jgi:hypothetical protein